MARAISRARTRLAVLALLISGLAFAGLAPAQAAGTAVISGTVVGPAGVDVSQTTVSLVDGNSGTGEALGASTTVNAAGEFSFTGLSAGQYKLLFSNPGAVSVWNGGAPSEAAAPWITLTDGQTATQDAALVHPGGSIAGTVTVPAGGISPQNVNVEAYSEAWGDAVAASAAPDSEGKYTLSGLLPGTYKVKFTFGIQPDPPVWNGDAATRAEAPGIVVTNGDTVTGQNASFIYTGSVSGTAKTPDGVALTNRRVILQTADGGFAGDADLDAQGRYRIEGLAAGRYKAALTSSLPGGPSVWYKDAENETSATVITVGKNAAVTGIDFMAPAESHGVVTGRVAGYTGDAEVAVAIYPANDPHPRSGPPLAIGVVNPDGSYAVVGLPTAKVKAVLIGEIGGFANQWYGGTLATSRDISVVDGKTTRGIDFTAVPEAVIKGTAKKPFGNPAYVEVVDLQGNYIGDALTNDDGTYAVHGLPAGSYKVQFEGFSAGRITAWYGGKTFETAAVVTVVAGQTVTGIDSDVIIGGAKPTPKPTTGQPKPTAPPVVVQPAGSTSGGELAATGTPATLQPLGLAGGALGAVGLLLLLAARVRIRR